MSLYSVDIFYSSKFEWRKVTRKQCLNSWHLLLVLSVVRMLLLKRYPFKNLNLLSLKKYAMQSTLGFLNAILAHIGA